MQKHQNISNPTHTFPHWYSPDTGIYRSTQSPITLPQNPYLDLVSFIFSHENCTDLPAFTDSSSGFTISYKELFSIVKSTAFGLQKIGVKKGDVVLLLLPNSVYFPVVFLGVLYIGAIVTTMNPLSSAKELEKQVGDSNACIAFGLMEQVEMLRSLGIRVVCVPGSAHFDGKDGCFHEFFGLIYGGGDLSLRPIIRQDDTAVIMYSSGTTGASKGVVLTHRNFISMVELFVKFEASQYEYESVENVYLAVLPMFHVYGMSLFVVGLLSLGCRIIVMGKFEVDDVVRVIDTYGVTHFPVVPPMVTWLTKRAKNDDGNSFKSLKQVSCGAAPLYDKTIQDFVETLSHVDLIQGYGMTESTAVGTRGFNPKENKKYSSIGLLAPNTEAKVVDWVTGSFLPPGSSGELWIRSPGVMKGYLKNVEATAMTIDQDGWLHTGDIAYVDNDGYFYLVDRLKEIIKYKGFQIAPADLEALLISHPEITDVGVTGFGNEESGEVPVAFVVKKNGSSLTQTDVIDYVAKQVAPYKKVRKVIFVNSIPKSAAGKIIRRELRKSITSTL